MTVKYEQETIIAQCTPKGTGALALLRISGNNSLTIADQISKLTHNKKISTCKTHSIEYGWIINNDGNIIDQVLFFIMKAPHSFTGQDTVEISCHNNPFIIELIIQIAINQGARLAREGEFTQRALLNQKIDLLQAEAINELIHANTQRGIQKSLEQLQGSLSSYMYALEQDLLHALALTQASFEFLDEQMEFGDQISAIIQELLKKIDHLCTSFDHQKQIREGFRIAFIGSVNVGKSSLFNLLLGHQRSIVTPIAGTTRDTVEAGLYKNGNYWTVIDTAGLRKTDDIIEQEGIIRSCQEAQKADLILLIADGSRAMMTQERSFYDEILDNYGHKTALICTKADLEAPHSEALPFSKSIALKSSIYSPKASEQLETLIQTSIERLLTSLQAPFLINKRHLGVLLSLKQGLLELIASLNTKPIAYELIAYQLNDLLVYLADLTGKSISEQAMDQIFRSFCIGK